MVAPKLDQRNLLRSAIACQSVKLPGSCLNEKGKANFFLQLEDQQWKPSSLGGRPLHYLKQVRADPSTASAWWGRRVTA